MTATTYADLQKQIQELQAKAEEARRNELSSVIADVKTKITTYGLTAADLGFYFTPAAGSSVEVKKPRKPTEAKYRHPENAELTWSGKGIQSKWITHWLSEDKKRKLTDLLINKPAEEVKQTITAPVVEPVAAAKDEKKVEAKAETVKLADVKTVEPVKVEEKKGFFGR